MNKFYFLFFAVILSSTQSYSANGFKNDRIKVLKINYGSLSCDFFLQDAQGDRQDLVHSDSKDFTLTPVTKAIFEQTLIAKSLYGVPMGAVLIGNKGIYGTKLSVSRARRDVIQLKEPLFEVALHKMKDLFRTQVGEQNVNISIIPSLIGSAVTRRGFGDLDINSTLVVQTNDYKPLDFSERDSTAITALEIFFKAFIEQKVAEGFIFSDFKAGEYDYIPESQMDTKSKAIKWTLSELRKGEKSIHIGSDNGPQKTMTLKEALSQNGRIKLDLFAKTKNLPEMEVLTRIKERYIECTIMFILAGQRGNKSPILAISKETSFPEPGATGANVTISDTAAEMPLRSTTLFFEPEHSELARKLSVTAPKIDLYYLNSVMLNAAKTYLQTEKILKALRILYVRSIFWSDTKYAFDDVDSRYQIYRSLEEVIYKNTIIEELNILYNLGDSIVTLQELRYPIPRGKFKNYYNGVNKYLKNVGLIEEDLIFNDAEHAKDTLNSFINEILLRRIDEDHNLKRFLDWVLNLNYVNTYSERTHQNMFLSFKIPQHFISEYQLAVQGWSQKYPNIEFEHPEDIHMTVAFLGKINVDKIELAKKIVRDFNERIKGKKILLKNSRIDIMGRKNSHLSVVFDIGHSSSFAPIQAEIVQLKRDLLEIGMVPDVFELDNFKPHISVAAIRDNYLLKDEHLQVTGMLYEDLFEGEHELDDLSLELMQVLEIEKPKSETKRNQIIPLLEE